MPPADRTPTITMTEEALRGLVRDTVKQSVEETFIRLGIQVNDPIEMQKDFQHLRDWRVTTASMKTKALLGAVGLVVSGLAAAAWMALTGGPR